MSDSRPKWTLSEAVERTGASRSTLRRRLDQGKFPGAYRDQGGQWRIPLTDLLAEGFTPASPLAQRLAQGVATDLAQPESDIGQVTQAELENRVRTLEIDLLTERAHRSAAEQVALAHEKRAETAERALRMIEAGTSATTHMPEREPATTGLATQKEEPAQRPARWWQRKK